VIPPDSRSGSRRRRLRELAILFLRLGTTAFGGPAAHIAMMEDEVVRRRGWLTREEFLDLLGATNLIPGPSSTEMAIHVGHRRAGGAGLLVAGACFILPAFLIVLAAAAAYVRFRTLPEVDALLYGIKPVVIAIVLQALGALGRSAVKGGLLAVVGAATAAAALLGLNEVALLFLAGGVVALAGEVRRWRGDCAAALLVAPVVSAAGVAAATGVSFSLGLLFSSFVKIGAVLFGSGYVLLAFLRQEFVERLGWLSEGQLLDAVAVGQVSPGPLFTTATFIGYVLAGVPGAVVATAGIFLPAFVFVAVSGPLVPRIRRSRVAGAFLDGVNVAAVALIAVVTWQLGRAAIVDAPSLLLAVASAALLLGYRVNPAWLVLAGGLAGLTLSAARAGG
jgi:chromate transporter